MTDPQTPDLVIEAYGTVTPPPDTPEEPDNDDEKDAS